MSRHVGFNLVAKAPLGALLTVLTLVALLATQYFYGEAVGYGLAAGVGCALLLLAYWLGKGGAYFILALAAPLLLVVLTPLPNFVALAELIVSYFLGASLLLSIYHLFSRRKRG